MLKKSSARVSKKHNTIEYGNCKSDSTYQRSKQEIAVFSPLLINKYNQ